MERIGLYVSLTLAIGVCTVFACDIGRSGAQSVPTMTPAHFAQMRLCLSESSTLETNDCRAIKSIVERRAAARGVTVEQYIRTHHTRHIQSSTRPWIGQLTPQLEKPAGWPARVDWNGRNGLPGILRVLEVVQTARGHGCSEAPLDWGGRVVDCYDLQERLRGDWHEVDCGNTVNMMIARGHVEPVPDLRCDEVTAALRERRAAIRAAVGAPR